MTLSWHQQYRRANRLKRTDVDGTVFDSVSELRRWKTLQQWQLAGDIKNLRRQVSYPLIINDTLLDARPILTPTGKTACYKADFVYERRQGIDMRPGAVNYEWTEIIEDHKGYHSREAQFRIAVFEAIYGVKVLITKGKGKS